MKKTKIFKKFKATAVYRIIKNLEAPVKLKILYIYGE